MSIKERGLQIIYHQFIRWIGYYEAKVEREAQYQELMVDYLR